MQASQWQDAITAYSEAINACADAPPVFSAVLHSNRAAAYQGLQQYADAVADSLRAKALDPTYGKVCSEWLDVSSFVMIDPSCGKELFHSSCVLCFVAATAWFCVAKERPEKCFFMSQSNKSDTKECLAAK